MKVEIDREQLIGDIHRLRATHIDMWARQELAERLERLINPSNEDVSRAARARELSNIVSGMYTWNSNSLSYFDSLTSLIARLTALRNELLGE